MFNKNWKKFLLNEEQNKIASYNLAYLQQWEQEDETGAQIYPGILEENFDKITPLHHFYIVKDIGFGAFGVAFFLNNDHIFKVFSVFDDVEDVTKDKDWEIYSRLYEKGPDSQSTLMVYDLGWIDKEEGLAFVETNKVITISEYLEMTGRKKKAHDERGHSILNFQTINRFIQDILNDPNLSNIASNILASKIFEQAIKNKQKYSNKIFSNRVQKISKEEAIIHNGFYSIINLYENVEFTKDEILSLLSTYIEFMKKHGVRDYDIHSNNIGVATYTPGGSNIKFVIFDF